MQQQVAVIPNMEPRDEHRELDRSALVLQRNIQKLIVEDFRLNGPMCALPITLGRTQQTEMCVQISVLSHLYGPESYHKLLLEAYLWTPTTTATLINCFGWLEGGVVVIDSQRGLVSLPHVDHPGSALRLPKIRPYDHAASGMQKMISREDFDRAWNETCSDGALFSEIDEPQRGIVLQLLGREVFDHRDRAPDDLVHDHIIKAIVETAHKIDKSLFATIVTASYDPETLRQTLILHLTALVENRHLRNLRLGSNTDNEDYQDKVEFLKFFGQSAKAISKLEREFQVLFVPDGEVSLLLLEHVLSEDGPTIAEEAEKLGLLRNQRAERLAAWLRDTLKMSTLPGFDRGESEYYEPLLEGETWEWLGKAALQRQAALTHAVGELLANSRAGAFLLPSLQRLCGQLWPDCLVRRHDQIQPLSPIAIPIHRYLRQDEGTNRALLAFPLTGWSLKSEVYRSIAVYFVGTIEPKPGTLLSEQIEAIRSLVFISSWPTIARSLENEEEILQRTTNIVGHDLKNRLDESEFETTITSLIESSPDESIRSSAEVLIGQLKMLYGTVELYRCISKITSDKLPTAWADKQLIKQWPPVLVPSAYVTAAAEACDCMIRYVGSCYAPAAQRTGTSVYLRFLNEMGQAVETVELNELSRTIPMVCFPPFSVKETSAGPQAILAGLTELVRNAIKTVTVEAQAHDMCYRYGMLHVDCQILAHEPDIIEVNLWNPIWRAGLRRSATIDNLQWMYKKLKAVRVSPARQIGYDNGNGEIAPYARSTFKVRLGHLQFDGT